MKQAASTTVSQPSSPGVVTGHAATDKVTVTGNTTLGAPTGRVTFYECGPSPAGQPCTVQVGNVGTTALMLGAGDSSTATSPGFVPTTAGTYCFGAYYSGDSQYLNSNDTTTDECFQVGLAPSITSFSPKSGKPDAKVSVNGKNLSGATKVTVGGEVVVISTLRLATKITFKAAIRRQNRKIRRGHRKSGTAKSKTNFKVT